MVSSASASATSSTTATAPASSQTECEDSPENPPILAVGAGVGVPLALLAMGLGTWAVIERRKRQRSLRPVSYSGVKDGTQTTSVGFLGSRANKAELVSSYILPRQFNTKSGVVTTGNLESWTRADEYQFCLSSHPSVLTTITRIPIPGGMNFNDRKHYQMTDAAISDTTAVTWPCRARGVYVLRGNAAWKGRSSYLSRTLKHSGPGLKAKERRLMSSSAIDHFKSQQSLDAKTSLCLGHRREGALTNLSACHRGYCTCQYRPPPPMLPRPPPGRSTGTW